MKKNILFLFVLGLVHLSYAQQSSIVEGTYPVAFQKKSQLFLQVPEKNKQPSELTDFTNLEDKIWDGDVQVLFPDQISGQLSIKENWVFYSGIQSPYDQNNWLYLERTIMGNDFNLFLFDNSTGAKKLLINNSNSIGNYAFRPLCWSANKNVIYLERLEFDSGNEHEGLYSYSLSTGELRQFAISEKYMTTPIISPDRKSFVYITTSDEVRELIHGVADRLMVYTIETSEETLLSEEVGTMHQALGWYTNEPLNKQRAAAPSANSVAQLSFKLPWVGGLTYCVTRDGSNAPPGPAGSSTSCANLGAHSYAAATDFDTPNNADEKILAVAAGTVTSVIYSSTGYGNHVIITHSDNYRTRYGHLKSIAITQGQQVQQGCYIGIEGTTGNSSGDHLHLEYETPGGGANVYATFSDCGGCVPHRGYSYTSANSVSPCTAPPSCGTPSSLSASSVTQTTAVLNWSSVSGATSYNVQYKPSSSTSWTTVSSATTSKSISGLSAATSYQYKVRAVCSSAGSYSSVSTFTTGSSSSSNSTITVGTGTSAYSAHPFGTVYMDERTQYIITKSELISAGWSSSAPHLKSMAFNVLSAASQPMGSFTITIAHIASASFTSTSFLTGTNATTVYSGTVAAVSGWNTYNFSSSFAYNGTSNLLVTICWNNSSFTANSSVQSFSYSSYLALYYRADLSSSGVCAKTTGTRSYYRPNTKLGFGSVPQSPTFDNDGERNFEIPLDAEIANETTFEVFPNPFDGNILNGKFSVSENKQMDIAIYDMLGRQIFAKEVFAEAGVFSLSLSDNNLQPGMYLFMGVSDDKRYTKTLIVK